MGIILILLALIVIIVSLTITLIKKDTTYLILLIILVVVGMFGTLIDNIGKPSSIEAPYNIRIEGNEIYFNKYTDNLNKTAILDGYWITKDKLKDFSFSYIPEKICIQYSTQKFEYITRPIDYRICK